MNTLSFWFSVLSGLSMAAVLFVARLSKWTHLTSGVLLILISSLTVVILGLSMNVADVLVATAKLPQHLADSEKMWGNIFIVLIPGIFLALGIGMVVDHLRHRR